MDMKELPIGVQTFEDIVSGNYYYVDKTGMVHQLSNKFKYVFLNRPRRFGKSLLSSTFHSYFAGEKELFDGLEAGRLETEWVKHPVFHFDMSTAKHMNEELLLEELNEKLHTYELVFGRGETEKNINQRLAGIVRRSVEQTGAEAVIIIDEYDAPLLDVMNDRERLIPMRQIMRNFYSPIKSLDPYLRFVFITGINKFAQLSIFSDLNNLKNISMLPEFSAVCGISQSELERVFPEQIVALAKAEGVSGERALELLKENYDGYHFCAGSEDIYNPFSLLNAFSDRRFGKYWFETATPTYLIERLERKPIDERELDSYTLGYPNKEVRSGFLDSLLAGYNGNNPSGASFVIRFNAALKKGDIDEALSRMQSFLAGMPNDLENKTEKHYQTIIYLIFSLLGYHIRTEDKSAVGRADAVCWTQDSIYVFEFKVDSTAETALKQIDDKGYMIPYRFEDGKRLVKIGVNISTVTRTIDGWVVDFCS